MENNVHANQNEQVMGATSQAFDQPHVEQVQTPMDLLEGMMGHEGLADHLNPYLFKKTQRLENQVSRCCN